MEKIAGLQKNSKKVLLSVLLAVSILWTGTPVHAVGPYFENESQGPGQFAGPNPVWPRPNEPLWSPSSPALQSRELLKKGEIVLRNPKEPDTARGAPPDVIDVMTADKNIASLMERRTP